MDRSLLRPMALLAGLCAASQARAGVVVVDPGGGPGAAMLQAALDAAQPGDILLVRDGDYSSNTPLLLQGKGLVLVSDAERVVQLPGLTVKDVPPDQRLMLRGFTLESPPGGPGSTAGLVLSNIGTGWVEDSTCIGPGGEFTGIAAVGMIAIGAECILERCELRGGDGLDAAAGFTARPGGAGYVATTQLSVLHATRAMGGIGGDGKPSAGGAQGGPGIVASGELSIMGGVFTGGDEGTDNPATSKPGPGALLLTSALDVRDTKFVAGAVQGLGTPVPPTVLLSGSHMGFPAATRTLGVTSVVRELQPVTVHVRGEPGDLCLLFLSTELSPTLLAAEQGVFLLPAGPTTAAFLLGVADGTGRIEIEQTMPRLPVGLDGLALFSQLGVTTSAGEPVVGTGSAFVWVSAVF